MSARFVPYPIEWPRHPTCRRLRQADPLNESRWAWLVNQAHMSNAGGALVLSDGTPLDLRDFADEHDQDLAGWEFCVAILQSDGLLERKDSTWSLSAKAWAVWHRDTGEPGPRFFPVPLHWPRHPQARSLRMAGDSNVARWLWLVHLAHVANSKGSVLLPDGTPLTAVDFADEHDHDLAGWENSLALFTELGMLTLEHSTWRIPAQEWSRWHRDVKAIKANSKKREQAKVRKRNQRQREKADGTPIQCPPDRNHVTHSHAQSRTGHAHVTHQSRTCHAPVTPMSRTGHADPPIQDARVDQRSRSPDLDLRSNQINEEANRKLEPRPPEREPGSGDADLISFYKKFHSVLDPAFRMLMGRAVEKGDLTKLSSDLSRSVWTRCRDPDVRAHALAWGCHLAKEQLLASQRGKRSQIRNPWPYAIAVAPRFFDIIAEQVRQNRFAVSREREARPIRYRREYAGMMEAVV